MTFLLLRLAILRNMQKQLAAMGVPLVCVSYTAACAANDANNSTSRFSRSAEKDHPVVSLWRTICRPESSSRYSQRNSQQEETAAALIVTDACHHPRTRYLCGRVSQAVGPCAVVAIDSNSLGPDSIEWDSFQYASWENSGFPSAESCWALLEEIMQVDYANVWFHEQ
jgi:hypothetical protein